MKKLALSLLLLASYKMPKETEINQSQYNQGYYLNHDHDDDDWWWSGNTALLDDMLDACHEAEKPEIATKRIGVEAIKHMLLWLHASVLDLQIELEELDK